MNAPSDAGRCAVFISHDSRDAVLADAFHDLLKAVSSDKVEVFSSSARKGDAGIEYGDKWFEKIVNELDKSTNVVCLLTERSLEKPWILFEAGYGRGKPGVQVHGLLLGIDDVDKSPFAQFQNPGGSEAELAKLVRELCSRLPGRRPKDELIKAEVQKFRRRARAALACFVPRRSWRRTVPLWDNMPASARRQVLQLLDTCRHAVQQFLQENGVGVSADSVRANLLLPDCNAHEKSQFPGQLYFVSSAPKGAYGKQELSNRFAPGEGVSGRVFLDGVAFIEDGKVGVSAKKLKAMPEALSAVAGFPLLDARQQHAFGVVCVDIVGAHSIDSSEFADRLFQHKSVMAPIREMAALLDPNKDRSFELEFCARAP